MSTAQKNSDRALAAVNQTRAELAETFSAIQNKIGVTPCVRQLRGIRASIAKNPRTWTVGAALAVAVFAGIAAWRLRS